MKFTRIRNDCIHGFSAPAIAVPPHPPQFCSKKWIGTYACLVLLLAILVITTGLLYFVPSAKPYKPGAYWEMTTLLPVYPSSVWVSSIIIQARSCNSIYKLYHVPCKQLNASNELYSKSPSNIRYKDHIYCLEGSVFYFELAEDDATVNISLYESSKKPEVCENKPGVSRCIQLNETHKSDSIEVWATGDQGTFYSWDHSPNPVNVNYSINRYYYNAELYTNFLLPPKPLIPIHEGFLPFNLTSDTCLLLSLDDDCDNNFTIQPARRQDILFWPGLAAVLIVVFIFAMITVVQPAVFQKKKNNYVLLQNRA